MSQYHIRIATHRSPLALMYTKKVASEIQMIHPHINIELLYIDTRGDKFYFEPLAELGGKCLYIEDVDRALLDGRAELAAHVVEERASAHSDWPRGWVCAKSQLAGDDSLYFFTEFKRISEHLFPLAFRDE